MTTSEPPASNAATAGPAAAPGQAQRQRVIAPVPVTKRYPTQLWVQDYENGSTGADNPLGQPSIEEVVRRGDVIDLT